MKLLELFAGTCAISKAFAKRGWTGTCVDIKRDIDSPTGFEVLLRNGLELCVEDLSNFDFIWASSPCEQFAVHGMKHFHANPPYPYLGIKLFNETRELCELSRRPYIMENVRAAQKFVGPAVNHCGSFYLWGNAVPPLMPQGIKKGATQMRRDGKFARRGGIDELMYMKKTGSNGRGARLAVIPLELAACVADYAERLLEQLEAVKR